MNGIDMDKDRKLGKLVPHMKGCGLMIRLQEKARFITLMRTFMRENFLMVRQMVKVSIQNKMEKYTRGCGQMINLTEKELCK